jgi:hypothetical protein
MGATEYGDGTLAVRWKPYGRQKIAFME